MKIISATILSLCFTSAAFAREYQCAASTQNWKYSSIETSGEPSASITFADDSTLSVFLSNISGDEDNFSAAGHVGRQRINLYISKSNCDIDGTAYNYSLEMSRNDESLNGCCN